MTKLSLFHLICLSITFSRVFPFSLLQSQMGQALTVFQVVKMICRISSLRSTQNMEKELYICNYMILCLFHYESYQQH